MKTEMHLFEGIGIELEYMIVDETTTSVRPVADSVFSEVAGEGACEYLPDEIGWSNELARHVIELKNSIPHLDIPTKAELFHTQIIRINGLLKKYGCRLMPTGMHPLMDPHKESMLWPVDEEDIYHTYDRIFDCRGHGWTNLQSIHCNISFAGDDEFARLHTAIRLVLPLLPALCASTPYVEGRATGLLDNRLEFYRYNQKAVPLVTGSVIPEEVFSRNEYEQVILQPMYHQIAPLDPEHVVRYEWLNSRGAIARFDRMAIEIRLMDIQECPVMDCAICALVIATVKALAEERISDFRMQCGFSVNDLQSLLLAAIRNGGATSVNDIAYLAVFGLGKPLSALSFWQSMAERLLPEDHFTHTPLQTIFTGGTLAERMVRSAGNAPDRRQLIALNTILCDCLAGNRPYV